MRQPWFGWLAVSLGLVAAGCATGPRADRPRPLSFDTTQPVAERPLDRAIAEGVAFLLKSQNPDGSWGTGLQTRGTEIYSMVPGSHDAYRDGTTALCVMALREALADRPDPAVAAAHSRGVKYLAEQADARRDSGPLLYNIWAHIYGLQALAIEMRHNSDPALRSAALRELKKLQRYETYVGGWNYYDFAAQTQSPSLEPTSFGTAAGLVALHEARQSGIPVPQRMIDLAVRRVEECRLPDGAYLYDSGGRYIPSRAFNRIGGSAGRMQSCNFALWLWGSPRVGEKESADGLRLMFENHKWLDMGRKRPYPHEAWYFNSGYYYYFGHYYAARIIEKLPPSQSRAEFARELVSHVAPYQEADGSWWDYAMWDYHKPYGTAYAVMTLLRCREAMK